MKKPILFILAILLFFCCLISLCLCGFYLASTPINIGGTNNGEVILPTQINQDPKITYYPQNTGELSIYNEDLIFKKGEQVYVSEMYLLEQIVDILNQKSWQYQKGDNFPINRDDLLSLTFTDYEADEAEREQNLTIPTNMEYLYLSSEAISDIESLILTARDEYLTFLKIKGVAQKYLDEINSNTFPTSKQRFTYHPINDPDAPPSATEALIGPDGKKADFSQLQMDIYPVDIYNNSNIFADSGILADTDSSLKELKLRNMGLRYLIYHEMGHVLQKAFDTVNCDETHKQLKSSWINAERSLYLLTDKYAVDWSYLTSTNDINNRIINNESQADGVAYQALIHTYNMSNVQARLTWEHLFGRLETARDQWDKAMNYFEVKQPELSIDEVPTIIFDTLDDFYSPGTPEIKMLLKLTRRLDNLPAYGGYFHPMLPQDSQEFWDYLEY